MTNIYPDLHSPAPKPKWYKRPIVWLPAVAAIVAFGLGSGSASAKTVEVEKVVEKTVPGPERVVTKEVKVPTTPAACLEYIRLAEQVYTISAEAVGEAAKLNAAGIDRQTQKLGAIKPDLQAAKAGCR